MASPGSIRPRRISRALVLCALVGGGLATLAPAAGPGGWDHLGDRGTPGTDALDLVASALEATPDALYVGGEFTDAGGVADADRIATWNGSTWGAVSSPASQITNGRVSDIAVAGGKVYAGGTFQNAGGDANADHLAVWDGTSWAAFCDATGPAFGGNVTSLQVVEETLYVGGTFQDGAGIASADFLLACDLMDGTSRSTVLDPAHPFAGAVYALAADDAGTLYAGGGFTNLEDIAAADNVAYLPLGGAWQPMGAGAGQCGCAVPGFVRGLATVGTDAYVGTDANDVAGIAQADHVARWNGTAWSAVGAGSGGENGWFPATTSINALAGVGPKLFATGTFLNANGDARADHVAFFDGAEWHPLGSDGAGNGPWSGTGLALEIIDRRLYAAGSFTSAGGDAQAQSVASFSLTQVIAYPTPTVTPGPSAQPTPTVTPGPSAQPTPTVTPGPSAQPTPTVTPASADLAPPKTSLRRAKISHADRKATFGFGSGERGATFTCKLDRAKAKPCSSPKTYKRLEPGRHVFRVTARDAAGNRDATPSVKRFRIRKRRPSSRSAPPARRLPSPPRAAAGA